MHEHAQKRFDDIFLKIARGELPATIVFQDDTVVAFEDINKQAPIHILIVPIEKIASLTDVLESHILVLGHMVEAAAIIAGEVGVGTEFRLINNCGEEGGQEVYHFHVHLLGGKDFGKLIPGEQPPVCEEVVSNPIEDLKKMTDEELRHVGGLFLEALKTAQEKGIAEKGFRVVIEPQQNNLKLHVFGGSRLSSKLVE